MEQKYTEPEYAINDYYLTQAWREKKKLPTVDLTNKDVLAKLKK